MKKNVCKKRIEISNRLNKPFNTTFPLNVQLKTEMSFECTTANNNIIIMEQQQNDALLKRVTIVQQTSGI